MGTFTGYMLSVAVVMTMLYLIYKWLMSSATTYAFNRAVIICIYVVSWILPLAVPLIELKGGDTETISIGIPVIEMAAGAPTENAPGLGIYETAVWIYLVGCALTLLFTLWSFIRMIRILREGAPEIIDGVKVYTSVSAPGPFSWARYIVVRPCDHDEHLGMVVTHELEHQRLYHWTDLLLAQATVIMQWFSPAAWLLTRELKNVHEFQADQSASRPDAAAYQLMLLKKTAGSSFPTFADSLNHSQTKLRITMMLKNRSNPRRRIAAMALPAAAVAALFALTQPAVADIISSLERVDARFTPEAQALTSATDEKSLSPGAVNQVFDSDMPEAVQEAATSEEDAMAPAETGEPSAEGKKEYKYSIFVNGVPFKGQITEINPKEIKEIRIVKNDPSYPEGKMLITTGAEESPTARPVLAAEQTAEYKGGMTALLEFLRDNIKYPSEAVSKDIQGRVIVKFVVNPDGTVDEATVVKGVDPLIDEEAVRAVKLTSGQWAPGMTKGKPVATYYHLPVTFRTKSDKAKEAEK